MANIQGTDIADLVTTSLNELGRLKFTDNISDYQDTIVLKRVINKNKMTFDSGPEVSFNIMMDHSGSAHWVGLGAQDVIDIPNLMMTGKVPWRHITWNWAMEGREPIMNSGASKIVDLIKTRRIGAFASAIVEFERAFWRVPDADDFVTMYGLPYYIVKSNTAATSANNDGFNGLAPAGHSTVANINPTTYRRWRNYATQYTAITEDDMVEKWRRMSVYTNFKPLVNDIPEYSSGMDRGYYTNYNVVKGMEDLVRAQNENLGNDVAAKNGEAMFRRVPITFVKELDLDTTDPVYAVNWSDMHTMGLRSWWMKETTVGQQAGQHTMSATHTDCTLNLLCRNRRKQGVIAKNTTMSY